MQSTYVTRRQVPAVYPPYVGHDAMQVMNLYWQQWVRRGALLNPQYSNSPWALQYSDMLHPISWNTDFCRTDFGQFFAARHTGAVRVLRAHCASTICNSQSQCLLGTGLLQFRDQRGYKYKVGDVTVTSPFEPLAPAGELILQSLKANYRDEIVQPFERIVQCPYIDTLVHQTKVVDTLPSSQRIICRYTDDDYSFEPVITDCTCMHQNTGYTVYGDVDIDGADRRFIFKSPRAFAQHYTTGRHDLRQNGNMRRGEAVYDVYHTMDHSTWQKYHWFVPEKERHRVFSVTADDLVCVSAIDDRNIVVNKDTEARVVYFPTGDNRFVSHHSLQSDTFAYRMCIKNIRGTPHMTITASMRIEFYCDGQRVKLPDVLECEAALVYHTNRPTQQAEGFLAESDQYSQHYLCSSIPHEKMANCNKITDPLYRCKNYSHLHRTTDLSRKQRMRNGEANVPNASAIAAENQKNHHYTWYPLSEFNQNCGNIHLLNDAHTVNLLLVRVKLPVNWQMQIFVSGYYAPSYMVKKQDRVDPRGTCKAERTENYYKVKDEWYEKCRLHAFVKLATVTMVHKDTVLNAKKSAEGVREELAMGRDVRAAQAVSSLTLRIYDNEQRRLQENAPRELQQNVLCMAMNGYLDTVMSQSDLSPCDKETLFKLKKIFATRLDETVSKAIYCRQIKGTAYLRMVSHFRQSLRICLLSFYELVSSLETLPPDANPYSYEWNGAIDIIVKDYGVSRQTVELIRDMFAHVHAALVNGEDDEKFMCGQLAAPLQRCSERVVVDRQMATTYLRLKEDEAKSCKKKFHDTLAAAASGQDDIIIDIGTVKMILHGYLSAVRDTARNLKTFVECSLCHPLEDHMDPAAFPQAPAFYHIGARQVLHDMFLAIFNTASRYERGEKKDKIIGQLREAFVKFDHMAELVTPLSDPCIFNHTPDVFRKRMVGVQDICSMNELVRVKESICRTNKSLILLESGFGTGGKSSVILIRDLRAISNACINSRLVKNSWYMFGFVEHIEVKDSKTGHPVKVTQLTGGGQAQCLFAGVFPIAKIDMDTLEDSAMCGGATARDYLKNLHCPAGETFAILVVLSDTLDIWARDNGVVMAVFDCPDVFMRSLTAWNVDLSPFLQTYLQQCRIEIPPDTKNPLYVTDATVFTDSVKKKTSMLLAYLFDGGYNENEIRKSRMSANTSRIPAEWCLSFKVCSKDLHLILAYIIYALNGNLLLDEKQMHFIAQCTIWADMDKSGNAHILNGVPGGGKTTLGTIVNILCQILSLFYGKPYRAVYMTHANSATTDSFKKMVSYVAILLAIRNAYDVGADGGRMWVLEDWGELYLMATDMKGTIPSKEMNGVRPKSSARDRVFSKTGEEYSVRKLKMSWGPRPLRIFAGRFQSCDVSECMYQATNFTFPHSVAQKLVEANENHYSIMHLLVDRYTDIYMTTGCSLRLQSNMPAGIVNHLTLDEVARLHVSNFNEGITWFILPNSPHFPVFTIFMGDSKQPGPYTQTFLGNTLEAIRMGESALVQLLQMKNMARTYLEVSYRCCSEVCLPFRDIYLPVTLTGVRTFNELLVREGQSASDRPYEREIPDTYKRNYIKHALEFIPIPSGSAHRAGATSTWSNPFEKRVMGHVCNSIDHFVTTKGLSVGILTHYTGQKLEVEAWLKENARQAYVMDLTEVWTALRDVPNTGLTENVELNDKAGAIGLQTEYKLGTHETWHGLECDVMIVLMTRDKELGHALQSAIACVSLSRARYANIVIGEVEAMTRKETVDGIVLTTGATLQSTDMWMRLLVASPTETTMLQRVVIDSFDEAKEKEDMENSLTAFHKWQSAQQKTENKNNTNLTK